MPDLGKEAVIGWEVSNGVEGFAVVAPVSGQVLATVTLDGPSVNSIVAECANFGGNPLHEVLVWTWTPQGWELQLWGFPEPSGSEGVAAPTMQSIQTRGNAASSPAVTFMNANLGRVYCRLFTADGRSIRTLLDAPMPAGDHSVRWDGLDDAGNAAPAGVYFVRIETADGVQSTKLVLAR